MSGAGGRRWTVAAIVALALAAWLGAAARAANPGGASGGFDDCLAKARARAKASASSGKPAAELRLALEVDFARCLFPTDPQMAALTGAINADRARLASDFLQGKLHNDDYTAVRRDRRKKYDALRAKPKALAAWSAGDADHDFVPDSLDRCPATPPDAATDAKGCPLPAPAPTPENARREKDFFAHLRNMRLLHNPSCDKSPPPPPAFPIEWGRGPQTKAGSFGFNIAVTKVREQVPGCEIFYEIEFRFTAPWNSTPAHANAVFRASEDLLTEPRRAVFGLAVTPQTPLSPGRKKIVQSMLGYQFGSWRVRAVDGSQKTSPWSPILTTVTAAAGVNG